MEKINIEDLTVGQAKTLAAMFPAPQTPLLCVGNDPHPYQIGACYLIRTVTMIQTGRLVAVTSQELVLDEAAWVADTGRFSAALKSLNFNEVEPFPDGRQVIIGRGAVVDAVQIEKTVRDLK